MLFPYIGVCTMRSRSRLPVSWPVLLLTLAACGPAEVPEYTIEQFLGTTSYTGASFAPDNATVLVSHDGSGVFNAYALPVDGGPATRLTHSDSDAVFALSYFPEDERFLYTADQGGNELNHVYAQDPDGTVTDLTPGQELKAQFGGWAHDLQSFYVATNERDPRYFDLYEHRLADGYPRELIYRNDTGLFPAGISPDERWIAFARPNTTNDSDVLVYDRETDELVNLTEHDGVVANAPQDFTADGTGLYVTTNEGREFAYLVRYDLASGEKQPILEADWDVMYASLSHDGSYLVVGINNDARTELRLYDPATMERIELPGVPGADITSVGFSRDEAMMAFYASTSRTPRDLYVQDLAGGGQPVRLTSSLNDAIDPDHLVDGRVVRFESYDGLQIPGILYKPHQASASNPVPALVWVHGGPGGQSRLGYSALIQYLVNHGHAIYAINNRGSSGYGKTFFAADDQRHGEADLGDVVASKEMLAGTGWIDGDRIGIIGGSYGGYMVLAALTLEPEAFEVGVDLFGISNWIRTLESIPAWWEAQREALYAELGDPEEDRERLRRISPLFNAENIVRPLMVLQGANDPRVLRVESDDIVEAARANGVPVEYIVFEDEGHGFRNKENQLEGYRAVLAFLNAHL